MSKQGGWVYCITYACHLAEVAKRGLVGGRAAVSSTCWHLNQSRRTIAFVEFEEIQHWYSLASQESENLSDCFHKRGFVPVVLGVYRPDRCRPLDAEGFDSAFCTAQPIDPVGIVVWDGQDWIDIDDFDQLDPTQAIDFEEDESGEQFGCFKPIDENPLANLEPPQ